jgi:hypothetical protein
VDQSEVRFVADQALLDQLKQIKGLLAHKNSDMTLAELIGEMAKLSLEKLQPKPPKPSRASQKNHSGAGAAPTQHSQGLKMLALGKKIVGLQ